MTYLLEKALDLKSERLPGELAVAVDLLECKAT